MTDTPLVSVLHVSRAYGQLQAVQDVSFTLQKGEVLGFLGPNGAGKSTTMQIITGNLAPSAGRVHIAGIDLLDRPKAAKAEIGYLPEQPPLYRELTVDEYLRFCARLNRIRRDKLGEAVNRAKRRCGLESVGRRLIGNLSKGYQQRVGIAQAIIHSPAVVVLDEPTVGLDPIQIREIRDLIRDLGSEHGVILSTHILPEVQMTCNRVQIINQGRLVFSDSIENLNRRMDTTTLLVAFDSPPAPAALEALDGIERVEPLGDSRFRLHHAPGDTPAPRLAEAAVAGGWGLRELTPEHKTLEQIFIDITSSEHAVEDAA